FFFQAEDGIRDRTVTGVQTCALPIYVLGRAEHRMPQAARLALPDVVHRGQVVGRLDDGQARLVALRLQGILKFGIAVEIVLNGRSEERRVGKEGRTQWWT